MAPTWLCDHRDYNHHAWQAQVEPLLAGQHLLLLTELCMEANWLVTLLSMLTNVQSNQKPLFGVSVLSSQCLVCWPYSSSYCCRPPGSCSASRLCRTLTGTSRFTAEMSSTYLPLSSANQPKAPMPICKQQHNDNNKILAAIVCTSRMADAHIQELLAVCT